MHKYLLITLFFLSACNEKTEVDIIITGAKVYTCDSRFSTSEAIAIQSGNILATGSKENILKQYKTKQHIDAQGKYIYPGFIDAHCHFSGYALDRYKCDLVGTNSYEDVLEKLIVYERNNELSWIYGRGWDQNDWEIKQFPSKMELDSLFSSKPVIIKRIDGHAVLCNQKALNMAGIKESTIIPGGIIEKKNGKLTGILIDNATSQVEQLIPALSDKVAEKYLKNTEQKCFSLGLTGVVDCGVKARVIRQLTSIIY